MGTESKYQTIILDVPALTRLITSALWGDDDSEEEGSHFEEDYEESFIDDGERVGDGPGSDMDVAPLPLFERDEDDGDDEVTEVEPPPVAYQRSRQAPIVISSDEEDEEEYADADGHRGDGRIWDEDEGDYHDAHSGSDDHVEHAYWSDDDPHDDDHSCGFYGYL